jgi:2-polyprenyl-6-methoxyphenol hydroxylase-like FAD-dependent oxidoreductase
MTRVGSGGAVDVVIVGAGPVGLTLACLLREAGVRPVVLERRASYDSVSKAGSIGPHAVEVLARLGLYDRLAEAERQTLRGYAAMAASGPNTQVRKEHFAGMGGLDTSAHTTDRHRRMVVEQPVLVELLAERAAQLDVEVRWDHDVVGLAQDGTGVSVRVATPEGEREIRARYLAGCDGPRSTIRRIAGFDFPGTPPTLTARQALVELADPGPLRPGFHLTAGGVLAYGTTIDSLGTFEFDGGPAGGSPLTRQELQDSVDRVIGSGVRISSIREGSRYSDQCRQAATYRIGRVLLAGDAAHIHPPIGAQGLTLGLGDAANLAGKLAAHLLGWRPASLLDSYTAERHAVAGRLLAVIRAQTALMRPDSHSRALRELFQRLMPMPQVNDFLARMSTFAGTRYDLGPADPLVGTLCPAVDLPVTAGGPVRLAEAFDGATGLLVLFEADEELGDLARPWGERIGTVCCREPWRNLAAALLRSDGCVAWVARRGRPLDRAAFREAAARWFGEPVPAREPVPAGRPAAGAG